LGMMENEKREIITQKVNEGLKRLLELADAKKQHMEQIFELTCKQSEVLSAEQVDKLLEYIEDKQENIDAIKVLDEEFSRIFEGIKDEVNRDDLEHYNPQGYELYVKLRASVSQIKDMVEAIYNLEVQNQNVVEEVIQDIKARITSISRGKKGYSAYKQSAPQAEGVFIDQRK